MGAAKQWSTCHQILFELSCLATAEYFATSHLRFILSVFLKPHPFLLRKLFKGGNYYENCQ